MGAAAKVLDFNQPDTAKVVGREIETTTLSLVQRLDGEQRITSLPALEQAVSDRQMLGDAIKRVEAFFAPFKKMAHDLHKALCNRENEILAPLKRVDNAKRVAIGDYKAEQDRLRLAEERRLAEEQRIEQESRAALEAALLESSGEHEMAAQVMEEALAAPMPIAVLPDATKAVDGLKFTRRWLWRYAGGPKEVKQTPPQILTRTMQLIPREFLCVDEKKLGAYVRSMKDSAKVPGIEIYYVDDPVR